jgi:hypothetical protein
VEIVVDDLTGPQIASERLAGWFGRDPGFARHPAGEIVGWERATE